MVIAQMENEISSAPHMPYYRRSGGRSIPPNIFQKNIFFLYLWAHLHNLIKQNNNFSILKKIENPLFNPLKLKSSTVCSRYSIN